MSSANEPIGYILKMYPRLSETFILNEILAHEAAGREVHIFSLRRPNEKSGHADLANVKAPVTYLSSEEAGIGEIGDALQRAAKALPKDECVVGPDSRKYLWTLHQAVRIADAAKALGITHLHAHFATEATKVARLASLISGIPYSFTAHAKDIFHESVEDEDLRRKARDAASIVTVSEFNVRFLRDRLGADAEPVNRIYNGLDLEQFPFDDHANEDDSLVLAVGRLVEKKGFEDLIDAFAILRERGENARCDIIGDGMLRDDLAFKIQAKDLDDRVRMLGALPRERVKGLIQNAAILACPCVVGEDGNRDGLPTVLLEAMALGTPCVSTPVTGIPEVIDHAKTGLLVPEKSPAELADAISALLADAALRRRLAKEARTLIEDQFDIHRNVAQMRVVFANAGALTPGSA